MNTTKVVCLLVLANLANIPDTCLVQLNQVSEKNIATLPLAIKAKITCQTFSACYSQVMKRPFHSKPVGFISTRHVPSQFKHAIRKIRWSACIIYELLINNAVSIRLKMLVASISPVPIGRLKTTRPFPIKVVALQAVGIYPLTPAMLPLL